MKLTNNNKRNGFLEFYGLFNSENLFRQKLVGEF